MQRNRVWAAVGLAIVLVTAGCTGALGSTNSLATTAPADAGSTIEVSADGSVETEPDRALVRVAVETKAADAETVRETLAADVSRMRSALTELGIDDDQIRTVQYDVREDHRDRREKRETTSGEATYRGIHAFEITVTDLNQTGTIIDTAIENGATRVDGVHFTLSDDRRRELHNDALRGAMSNAREQADTLAESANLTVSGVHAIRTGGTDYRPYRVEQAGVSSAGADTSIDSGPVTVAVQVQVTYNATAR